MSSMFIILLIIRIINTTSFNNALLMVSRWSSDYFHKIFGMHLQKGSIYLFNKTFLPPALYFWNYNPFPNGQTISLIGAQAIL